MAAQYETLSLRLYEILDSIGVSEEIRDIMRENAIAQEIIYTHANILLVGHPFKVYLFGSLCEGTTTVGLNPDEDSLCCYNSTVVDNISHSPQHGRSLLMISDETTKPGYYKLQLIKDKCPLNTINHNNDPSLPTGSLPDSFGRICHQYVQFTSDRFSELNGPATTRRGVEGATDQDNVLAVGCQYIPNCAKSWIRRVVSCNRLNEEQIKRLKEFRCFFVGIKHPSSQNDLIEWRLSFSLQERELMASLNPTQHKCYVLLKIIKKDIIQKRLPKSISSYHCKTCVLYAIEQTPFVFWRRGNILECIRFCIKLLLHWVNENRCPNYFVPDENMFDRLGYRTLRCVQDVLEEMLEHWCSFLWSLTCDNIGEVLYAVLYGSGPSVMRLQHELTSVLIVEQYGRFSGKLLYFTRDCLQSCRSTSADHAVLELHSIETYLVNTDYVEDHTVEETKYAVCYFIPYLRLQIAQCIASIMLTTRNAERLRMIFDKFKFYIEGSKDCDVISSKLLVASYCQQSERHDICERILLECETSLQPHVISVCSCRTFIKIPDNEGMNEQMRILRSQYIHNKDYIRTYTAGCLTFLPYQVNLVPQALHYEMYRSVNTPAGSRDEEDDKWFDWIVVDSKVYLYFLQYVLYSKINKPVYKQDAIDNLIHIMTKDENLGHLETAYNLLGWIYTKENKIQQAMECFLTSWRIRPIHNAAKWHLLEMIRKGNTPTQNSASSSVTAS